MFTLDSHLIYRVHTSSSHLREKDPDPEGAKLAATEDPLGEATKLVVMLKQHADSHLDTHISAFEVGMGKEGAEMQI